MVVGAVVLAAAVLPIAGTVAGAAPSDSAIEKRSVLKKADFAAGWTTTGRRAPEDSGLAVCASIDSVNAALVPISARSPSFVRPDTDNVLVTSSVVVLKSTKAAKGYLDPYRNDDAVRCVETVTEAALADRFASVRVYVTPTDDVPSGANEAVGFHVQITVTSVATPGQPSETAVIYQDLVFVRVGRALASFQFLNPAKSLPDQGELIDAVIGRLEDAL